MIKKIIFILLISIFPLNKALGVDIIIGNPEVVRPFILKFENRQYILYTLPSFSKDKICEYENGEKWECGKEAVEYLEKLIDGTDIICKKYYTQYSGFLSLKCKNWEGKDLSEALLEKGLAYINIPPSYAPESYVKAEEKARKQKLGFWKTKNVKEIIRYRKWLMGIENYE